MLVTILFVKINHIGEAKIYFGGLYPYKSPSSCSNVDVAVPDRPYTLHGFTVRSGRKPNNAISNPIVGRVRVRRGHENGPEK